MHHTIAVYSCFFGDPEPFNQQSMGDGVGYDRILFTDRNDLRPDGMRVVATSSEELGPAFESRRAKMLPHILLPEYDWVIYVDNRASLTINAVDLVRKIESQYGPEISGRFMFRHQERSSARDELDICFLIGHVNEDQWRDLIRFYDEIGFSSEPDLTHNAVIICKQGDAETEQVSELWFKLFLKYGRRDQLTLQPAEHLIGTTAQRLNFPLADIAQWPVYAVKERAKRIQSSDVKDKPFLLSPAFLRYLIEQHKMRRLIRSMSDIAR